MPLSLPSYGRYIINIFFFTLLGFLKRAAFIPLSPLSYGRYIINEFFYTLLLNKSRAHELLEDDLKNLVHKFLMQFFQC